MFTNTKIARSFATDCNTSTRAQMPWLCPRSTTGEKNLRDDLSHNHSVRRIEDARRRIMFRLAPS
jgi:hypothetical protein